MLTNANGRESYLSKLFNFLNRELGVDALLIKGSGENWIDMDARRSELAHVLCSEGKSWPKFETGVAYDFRKVMGLTRILLPGSMCMSAIRRAVNFSGDSITFRYLRFAIEIGLITRDGMQYSLTESGRALAEVSLSRL